MAMSLEQLSERFDALNAEVKSVRVDIKSLDDKVNRVAAVAARTAGDVQDIKHEMKGMATKTDIDKVIAHIDAFAMQSEARERAMVLHGASLTDHSVQLKDHEKRISALENRP